MPKEKVNRVKRYSIVWKKIFAHYPVLDYHPIYERTSKSQKSTNSNLLVKWTNDLNRYFSRYTVYKHMKIFST